MKNIFLSVVLATHNEEDNIKDCLTSVHDLADEIIIVDGTSEDRTVEIAKSFGAKIETVKNDPMFHNMKQKAIDKAEGKWILQLDADERVTQKLVLEITEVIKMDERELDQYQKHLKNRKLFLRHQNILQERDGKIGQEKGEYCAFFIPRLNYFLGKYLRYGGVYPDGVIRLIKKGRAYLPCKNVHEQMVVEGRVGWLENDLLHFADPSFHRYIERNSRYINLITAELIKSKIGKNPVNLINYCFIKPVWWFFLTQIRHKGILDGWQGVVFSFFSALRFPRAYVRYLLK